MIPMSVQSTEVVPEQHDRGEHAQERHHHPGQVRVALDCGHAPFRALGGLGVGL